MSLFTMPFTEPPDTFCHLSFTTFRDFQELYHTKQGREAVRLVAS